MDMFGIGSNKTIFYTLCAVGGLVIIYLLYYFFFKASSPKKQEKLIDDTPAETTAEDPREQLAVKLNKAGWTLYTRDGCVHCHNQLELFGEYAQTLNVVEANSDGSNVPDGIKAFPAWVNEDGRTVLGYQNPDTLISKFL